MRDLDILYEDTDFLVLMKPAGMLVHGVRSDGSGETIASWLRKKYPAVRSVGDDPETRPGIVHRLDRDTSGVLLVALRQDSFSYAKKLFQAHEVKKEYRALVWGVLPKAEGVISLPIGLRTGTTKRTTVLKSARMVKEAVTEYRTLQRYTLKGEEFSLLAVFPKTGRTHQIRVHLASLQHPVLHDALYGGSARFLKSKELGLTRQFLHAYALELLLPRAGMLRVEAPLPPDLLQALDQLIPVPAEYLPHS